MTETPVRPRPLKTAKYLLLGILLCAVVGSACFLIGRNSSRENTVDPVVVQARLSQISQLATVNYHYTHMAQFENSADFYGVTLPFTTKKFILTYDGEIKAGVDLSRAKVELREQNVLVTLPPAAILSHEIIADSVEVFDEKTSIFNPFTVEDFSSFQADQKAAVEEKALENGLLEEAAHQAAVSVEALLSPVLPEGFRVTVQS